MNPLLLIHTASMQVQRVADNTIGPAYRLPHDAAAADIEEFRVNGAPAPVPPTPAERAFADISHSLQFTQTNCLPVNN